MPLALDLADDSEWLALDPDTSRVVCSSSTPEGARLLALKWGQAQPLVHHRSRVAASVHRSLGPVPESDQLVFRFLVEAERTMWRLIEFVYEPHTHECPACWEAKVCTHNCTAWRGYEEEDEDLHGSQAVCSSECERRLKVWDKEEREREGWRKLKCWLLNEVIIPHLEDVIQGKAHLWHQD